MADNGWTPLSTLDAQRQAEIARQQQVYDQQVGALQGAGRGGPDLALLGLASGFLSPTKTGSFGESLGLGVKGMMSPLQQAQQQELDKAQKIAALRIAQSQLQGNSIQQSIQNQLAGQRADAYSQYMSQTRGRNNDAYTRSILLKQYLDTRDPVENENDAQRTLRENIHWQASRELLRMGINPESGEAEPGQAGTTPFKQAPGNEVDDSEVNPDNIYDERSGRGVNQNTPVPRPKPEELAPAAGAVNWGAPPSGPTGSSGGGWGLATPDAEPPAQSRPPSQPARPPARRVDDPSITGGGQAAKQAGSEAAQEAEQSKRTAKSNGNYAPGYKINPRNGRKIRFNLTTNQWEELRPDG